MPPSRMVGDCQIRIVGPRNRRDVIGHVIHPREIQGEVSQPVLFGQTQHGVTTVAHGLRRTQPCQHAARLSIVRRHGHCDVLSSGGAKRRSDLPPDEPPAVQPAGDCFAASRLARNRRETAPSPCGKGLGGGVRATSTPPPNPLPQGEGECLLISGDGRFIQRGSAAGRWPTRNDKGLAIENARALAINRAMRGPWPASARSGPAHVP